MKRHVKLFEEFANENQDSIEETQSLMEYVGEKWDPKEVTEILADELNGKIYKATNPKKSTIWAIVSKKIWDDGTPVLKYMERESSKKVKITMPKFDIVHDTEYEWYYFTDGNKWYGVLAEDGYDEIEDLPFNIEKS